MFIKKAQTMYILPIRESPNLSFFLKLRNLKKFAMSPNTHSTPTLVLLMAVLYAACCAFNLGFAVVLVVDKRGLRIYTIDFHFD